MIANETEFDLYGENLEISDAECSDSMFAFAALIGVMLVVTLGTGGAVAATPAGLTSVPGVKIVPIDTVGAGDTFFGYLAAALDMGASLEDAIQTANRSAALACLTIGAQVASVIGTWLSSLIGHFPCSVWGHASVRGRHVGAPHNGGRR